MSGVLRAVAPLLLAASTAGAAAAPLPRNPTPCTLQLTGVDDSGNRVLQTVAYALNRPGLLLTSLTATSRGRTRLERLKVAPDPTVAGQGPFSGPYPVAEVVLVDPSRDLLVLRAGDLEACVPPGGSGALPPRAEGEEVIGFRTPDGFRPRQFRGVIERVAGIGNGLDLMRIRLPDAGGAGTGFLFDREGSLIGSILPSSPGADPRLACAVAIDADRIGTAASDTAGRDPGELPLRPLDEFARTPAGRLAQALLLSRDDQMGEALRLLDEVESLSGSSAGYLMERGVLRFKLGKIDAAIEDFSRAARLDAGRRLAHYDLGIALGVAGRYEGAIEAFSRALEIDPGHALSRYHLALALQAVHRPEKAREECDRLGRLDATLAGDLKSLLGD